MLKKLIVLLGCISIIFVLVACSKKANTDPVPVYDVSINDNVYYRVGSIDKNNADNFLGEIKKLKGLGEEQKDTWYSTKFNDGDKVYKYKGKDISEAVIVESHGQYSEMKAEPKDK